MEERTIELDKAVETIRRWQEEGRSVEIRLRFRQGITLTHPGYVTIEPDGRAVVAHVVDRNHFFTTVIALSSFKELRLLESESAITAVGGEGDANVFEAVTIACRQAPGD